MLLLARILLVAGFCVGTLGAAGFDKTREPNAMALFVGGLVLLAAGGVLIRRSIRAPGEGGDGLHGERARFREKLVAIQGAVHSLEAVSGSGDPESVRKGIDAIAQGDLFDLTSAHEDLIALIGFPAYSVIWEGVASGERLLNRAWSMLTDGAIEEGLAELPLAAAKFDDAVAAFDTV